jgi:hypothetical protein
VPDAAARVPLALLRLLALADAGAAQPVVAATGLADIHAAKWIASRFLPRACLPGSCDIRQPQTAEPNPCRDETAQQMTAGGHPAQRPSQGGEATLVHWFLLALS